MMKSGIIYRQGEIFIMPFPFFDLSNIKQRPVLILSKSADNENLEDIITCGITSVLKDSKYSVLIDNVDLIEGAIPKKSRVKIDKLFTINQRIIKKKIGRLSNKTFNKVREEFFKLI